MGVNTHTKDSCKLSNRSGREVLDMQVWMKGHAPSTKSIPTRRHEGLSPHSYNVLKGFWPFRWTHPLSLVTPIIIFDNRLAIYRIRNINALMTSYIETRSVSLGNNTFRLFFLILGVYKVSVHLKKLHNFICICDRNNQ